MKAPDKIYVAEAMETEKGLFGLWTDKDHRDTPYAEYIRKEAILELANGMMDCFAPGGDCSQTLQMVIKHIESL